MLQPINASKKKWVTDQELTVREYIKYPKLEDETLEGKENQTVLADAIVKVAAY